MEVKEVGYLVITMDNKIQLFMVPNIKGPFLGYLYVPKTNLAPEKSHQTIFLRSNMLVIFPEGTTHRIPFLLYMTFPATPKIKGPFLN